MSRFAITDRPESMRGLFSLRVLDRLGRVIQSFADCNMIVNGARVAMSRLVSEGFDTGKVITRFGVGTNADTATPADNALTDCYANDLIGHDFPNAGTVRFLWKLGYDEANDKNISEFGLFCADGTLFSRKVRAPIFKASDLAFEGEWSIIF